MAVNPVNFKIAPLNLSQVNKIGLNDVTNKTSNIENDFANFLNDAINNVSQLEKQANIATNKFVAGEMEIHDALIAVEKSDIALQYTMAVRNKILDAYNEIMRMQI